MLISTVKKTLVRVHSSKMIRGNRPREIPLMPNEKDRARSARSKREEEKI